MRLLLDTHVFLWVVSGDGSLKSPTRRFIESADELYASAASLWEIAIKARLRKISADADAFTAAIKTSGFLELPVWAVHAARVASLPPQRHKDPFDRLLVAQAMVEPLRL